MGIEPTSEAWEASILPLYDARSLHLLLDYIRLSDSAYSARAPCFPAAASASTKSKYLTYTITANCSRCSFLPREALTQTRDNGDLVSDPSDRSKRYCLRRQLQCADPPSGLS